jgi:hypothetical protein
VERWFRASAYYHMVVSWEGFAEPMHRALLHLAREAARHALAQNNARIVALEVEHREVGAILEGNGCGAYWCNVGDNVDALRVMVARNLEAQRHADGLFARIVELETALAQSPSRGSAQSDLTNAEKREGFEEGARWGWGKGTHTIPPYSQDEEACREAKRRYPDPVPPQPYTLFRIGEEALRKYADGRVEILGSMYSAAEWRGADDNERAALKALAKDLP